MTYPFAFACIIAIALGIGWLRIFLRTRADNKLLATVTTRDRGTPSERRLVIQLLKMGVHPKCIYHDLYVEKKTSGYSQIDLVVATKTGIIVFEVKDYSGWIFGNGYHKTWTQVLAYGKRKYQFYNPVRQNHTHIQTLIDQSPQLAQLPIYSVVIFYGNCELREVSNIPSDVRLIYARDLAYIINQIANNPKAAYTDKKEVITILSQGVDNGRDPRIVRMHSQRIDQYLSRIS